MELVYSENRKEEYVTTKVTEPEVTETSEETWNAINLQRELRELGAYNFRGDARDPIVWMKAVNRLIEQYATLESED